MAFMKVCDDCGKEINPYTDDVGLTEECCGFKIEMRCIKSDLCLDCLRNHIKGIVAQWKQKAKEDMSDGE